MWHWGNTGLMLRLTYIRRQMVSFQGKEGFGKNVVLSYTILTCLSDLLPCFKEWKNPSQVLQTHISVALWCIYFVWEPQQREEWLIHSSWESQQACRAYMIGCLKLHSQGNDSIASSEKILKCTTSSFSQMGEGERNSPTDMPLFSQAASSSTRPCVPPSSSYPPHLPS